MFDAFVAPHFHFFETTIRAYSHRAKAGAKAKKQTSENKQKRSKSEWVLRHRSYKTMKRTVL